MESPHIHTTLHPQAEMELESMVGMQPALYHRYNVDENDEEDDDDDDDHEEHYKASVFGAQVGGRQAWIEGAAMHVLHG